MAGERIGSLSNTDIISHWNAVSNDYIDLFAKTINKIAINWTFQYLKEKYSPDLDDELHCLVK